MRKHVRYHKKRYGHHQKHTTDFLKTYYPYVPTLLMVLILLVFSLSKFRQSEVAVGGVGYLTLRHGLTRKQAQSQGKRVAVKHPLFDFVLLAIIGVCLQLVHSFSTKA